MVKKIKKSQFFRHVIQLVMFFLLPGLYATTFSEVRTVYKMIIGGNFNFLQALPSLIEFVAVMFVTVIIGRWFCGWICAFGAYNDLIYFISRKIFKGKFKVNEQVDSILKYAKYVVLLFIIIVSWTIGSNILESVSPWDAFGQMTNISAVFSRLFIGVMLLVLITIGAAFIERFFCRYLCPLGAIFAIISRIGITKIHKPKDDCDKCRACTINCSMGLRLYKVDSTKGRDCINCLKCTEICPRKNTNINILGQDLNQNLAGSVAMATMLGIYGITNFGVNALTKAGIISNNGGVLDNNALQGSTSQQYKDGTYTGSGQGFGGTTTVSVTIAGGKITDIKTISNQDTSDYYNKAFGIISKGIISAQTSNVDTVSGATYSSKGIMSAVEDALSQAGDSSSNSDNSSNTNAENNTSTNSADINNGESGKYKDGTYTGSGQGFGGTTTVSVTIAGGKITDIKTVSNQDTSDYYSRAFGIISKGIISAQTSNVDAVSGATYSSKGIISAVKDALSQASDSSSNSDNSSGTSENNDAVKDSNLKNSHNVTDEKYNDGTGTGFSGATSNSQNSGNIEKQDTQKKSERKVLVAYFSQARAVSEGADAMASATPYVGNTASAAYEIQKEMGGDIFEIVTEEKYPVSHKDCSAIAEQEMKSNARPALTTHVENMDSYDVIFIGYPIWWYIEPMAIRTFLEEYNLSGKTIIPFCTTLGAGVDESVKDVQSICPNSTVLNGLTLSTGQKDVSGDISKWLNKLDLSE